MKNYFNSLDFEKAFQLICINPYEAKLKFEKYIDNYPKDYYTMCFYSNVLLTLNDVVGAKEILEKSLVLSQSDKKFQKNERKLNFYEVAYVFSKLSILIREKKFKDFYEYYNNNKFPYITNHFKSSKYFCDIKLGLNVKEEYMGYLLKQVKNYSESEFLNHIRKHLMDINIEQENENSSVFAVDFDVKKVLEEVKKFIPSEKKLCNKIADIYIFKYDSCGRCNGKLQDYFRVVCIQNTIDFITMFPTIDSRNLPYFDLNYMHDSHNSKVKRLSQIEKFNRKYNIQ